MKEKFKNLIKKLLYPNALFAVFWVVISIAIIAVTLTSLAVDFLPEPLEYAFYGLSAVGLAYSVYLVVKVFPRIKNKLIEVLKSWKFTRTVLENYGFRTLVFALCSFAINVAYAFMQGYIALKNLSIWYGALATYYVVLTVIKGSLLSCKRKARKKEKTGEDFSIGETRTFGRTGLGLLLITSALSSTIFSMVKNASAFSYPGFTIYATAAYAFYKISMAIYNFIKVRKFDDLTLQAIRNVNLVDALVSILALQTALLDEFGTTDYNWIFNLITGIVILVMVIAIGLAMFIRSRIILKGKKDAREGI